LLRLCQRLLHLGNEVQFGGQLCPSARQCLLALLQFPVPPLQQAQVVIKVSLHRRQLRLQPLHRRLLLIHLRGRAQEGVLIKAAALAAWWTSVDFSCSLPSACLLLQSLDAVQAQLRQLPLPLGYQRRHSPAGAAAGSGDGSKGGCTLHCRAALRKRRQCL
jgi:hypothetical protein